MTDPRSQHQPEQNRARLDGFDPGIPAFTPPSAGNFDPATAVPSWTAPGYPTTPAAPAPGGPGAGTGGPNVSYSPPGYTGPGANQWQAAPKPGLIPLRPLAFGTLMGAPFRVLTRNPRASLGSALLLQAPISILSMVIAGFGMVWFSDRIASASSADRDEIAIGSGAVLLLLLLIPILLSAFSVAFLQGVLVSEVSRATIGEKRRMGELWKAVWPRVGHLFLFSLLQIAVMIVAVAVIAGVVIAIIATNTDNWGWALLAGFLLGAAFFLLFAWLLIKTSLVPSVIVLERRGVGAAIQRSWRLTNGYFWKTLGIQFLVNAIVSAVSQIVVFPVSIAVSLLTTLFMPTGETDMYGAVISQAVPSLIVGVISLLIGSISVVIQSSVVALIYIDLRMRKEGLDIDLLRYVEAGATSSNLPDPFTIVRSESAASAGQYRSGGPAGPQPFATPGYPSAPGPHAPTGPSYPAPPSDAPNGSETGNQ